MKNSLFSAAALDVDPRLLGMDGSVVLLLQSQSTPAMVRISEPRRNHASSLVHSP